MEAKDNVEIDDIMEARAAIYFDQSPPIITNLTQNKYVETILDVSEFTIEDRSVRSWPNPVDDLINLKTMEAFPFRTNIYNLLG